MKMWEENSDEGGKPETFSSVYDKGGFVNEPFLIFYR